MIENDKNIKLTIKQEKFCLKYHECGNASEAYRFAYCCEKMMPDTITERASRLLTEYNISTRVKGLQQEQQAKSSITKDKVLAEYAKIAFTSIAAMHNTWISRKEFEELTNDDKASIKSISTRTRRVLVGEDVAEIEEIKIELYDKIKALDSINKMLGFNAPERQEITGKDGKDLISPARVLTKKEAEAFIKRLEDGC